MNAWRQWENWLYGLLGAIINSAGSAITIVVIAPESFNLQEGLPKLINAVIVFSLLGAGLYLKQRPLPCLSTADEAAIVAARAEAVKKVHDQPEEPK